MIKIVVNLKKYAWKNIFLSIILITLVSPLNASTMKIAYLSPSFDISDAWERVYWAIQGRLDELGVKYEIQSLAVASHVDHAGQLAQVESVIAKGVDYVFLGPTEYEAAIPALRKLKKAGIFATATKSSTQNIAMNEVGREAIRKDKNFMEGDYLNHNVKPKSGLKTARMLGHITYSSEDIMDQKFGRKFQDIKSKIEGTVDYEVENYLQYKGEKFSDTFDANSYILMTKAMDGYDASFSSNGSLEEVMKRIKAKLLVIGFDSDWLYPPKRSKEIQLAAMNVDVECSCVILKGEQGHDSFLFASDRYVKIIKGFLDSK